MIIRKTFAVASLAALLFSTSLYAAEEQILDQSGTDQQTSDQVATASGPEQSVPMATGGIGDAEISDIATLQHKYSLKLIFAEPSGAYLADVGVVIKDSKKNVLVNASAQGPIVLVKLDPGTYTVTSTTSNDSKTQRVVVGNSGLRTYYVHLNSQES